MEQRKLKPEEVMSHLANFGKWIEHSYKKNPNDPVLPIYKQLVEDAVLFCTDYHQKYEKMESNVPVSKSLVKHNNENLEKYIQFKTIRNNQTVTVRIELRKIEVKFYDKDAGGPDQHCLEIWIQKKLANPGKLQQEFSNFLASENPNLIDFITDKIWKHIDESVEKEEQKVQRKIERVNRFNRQKTVSRENNTRYFFRGQKKEEEADRKKQDVENRRETRSMRRM